MERVIVTGANGFIGSALTKYLLAQGIEVYAVVKEKANCHNLENSPKLHIIEASFENYDSLAEYIPKNIDVFYHLAWSGVFGSAFKNHRLQLMNAAYAGDAATAAALINCKKFVLVGTINELESMHYFSSTECRPRYTCIYSTAKLASRMICKTIASNNGMEFNSAMLAMVYGQGDLSEMLPKVLMRAFLKQERPRLVEGRYLYDWIYIDDVARGLFLIGEKGKHFKTYFVGHEKLKMFRDIVEEVKMILAPQMELIFGEYPDDAAIDFSTIDTGELKADTGFECKADFKESILKTAKWIQSLDRC